VVASKPAIGGQVKTGQWRVTGTEFLYAADGLECKSVFARQLPELKFNTCLRAADSL